MPVELMAATEVAVVQPPSGSSRPAVVGVPRWRRALSAIGDAVEWIFGVLALVVGLAVLATIPGAQLLSLGYLLEVSGRIARTGHVRAGFVGVRTAARLGRIAIGVFLLMLPVWFAVSMRNSAWLIDPESRATRVWSAAVVLGAVLVILQIASACLRGGMLRSFLIPRPIRTLRLALAPGAYGRARDAVWDFAVGLRLPYYFWLGLRGFVGAVAWLILPVSLLAAASRLGEAGGLVGLIGGATLALVLIPLPFLQARFAAENRLGAMFELRRLRRAFGRAPFAFLIALAGTLLLALPLYLLKIEIVPREASGCPACCLWFRSFRPGC
jgi:hypothetical protein